ncbi:hypothetical protein KFK09_011792 [Dendrobium nobile]|uniref:Uncharacterized protein n=1 Tax=Dendrobium nobile TaxID=94219 RepID=A0A8T3BG20_DENNO|nr:hypothetical protein KFK09_011792 [Dendrobium nobile]
MGRAPCCDKANVKKGPWSPEEDAKLKSFIEEHGTGGNWIALPHKIGLKRCGKSCRLRWLNYLRPNIKHGGFSEEEDQIICNLFVSIGSRWSIIAAQLPGRTDNDIKNYWNTRLKKKLLGRRRDSSSTSQPRHLPNEKGCNPNPNPNIGSSLTLTSSALERLQLHMQLQGLNSPFSFYNNTALWPKFYPLGNDCKLFQTISTDAITTTVYPLKLSQATMEPSEQANLSNSMITSLQGSLGISSSSSSNLDIELHDLLYGKESQFINEMESFKEMNIEEGMGWWGSNGLDEKSLFTSLDSTSALRSDFVLQEYRMGYDL